MSLSLGIVGLPNVGKSTLFNALTKQRVDAANYPFVTIEPNVGVVKVPDARLDQLAAVSASEKVLPTTVEFVDIAGLVKGANEGQGLGNKFLANIREVDAIVQVVRAFEGEVTHVSGKVDPLDDIDVINTELILADLSTVEKRIKPLAGAAKSGDKDAQVQSPFLEKIRAALSAGELASTVVPEADPEKQLVRELQLLTTKPFLYVFNIAEDQIGEREKIVAEIQAKNPKVGRALAISVKIEQEISELPEGETATFLESIGLKQSGLSELIERGYQLLDLLTFFTSGPKESRAWTVTKGSTAPQAAGKIHTDFEKGFVKVEVISWQDFVTYKGDAAAKEAGKMHLEGKEYIMQDGDVVYFHTAQ